MPIFDRYVGKCKICGKEFTRKRISKETCSNACRKKLSRQNIAKRRAVTDLEESVVNGIRRLEILINGDFARYEVAVAISSVDKYTKAVMRIVDSYRWECQECGKISDYGLPSATGDCYCSEEHSQWVLQKKLML